MGENSSRLYEEDDTQALLPSNAEKGFWEEDPVIRGHKVCFFGTVNEVGLSGCVVDSQDLPLIFFFKGQNS